MKMEQWIVSKLREMYLVEKGGDFFGEIYADYRDEIDDTTAEEIADSGDPFMAFHEKLGEWYIDVESDCRTELISEIKRGIMDNPGKLDGEAEDFISAYVAEHVFWNYPADHFLDQKICVNITIGAGDANYDFVLNTENPANKQAGIMWLARTQGYSKAALARALKAAEAENPKGFLDAVNAEVKNTTTHMGAVTFLVRMTLREFWELRVAMARASKENAGYCGHIVLGKETFCGLMDTWSGAGSLFGIQLDKDVRIPVNYIFAATPDGAKGCGYQAGDVFGFCKSAWRDTLKDAFYSDTSVPVELSA